LEDEKRIDEVLRVDQAVLIRGQALPEENSLPKIAIEEMVPLADARVDLPALISIKVPLNGSNTDKASALHKLFETKPGPTEVRLRLEKPRDFAVTMDVALRVRPDKEFLAEVERLCGPDSVEIMAG
jgi:DNA polymerase-3 subunit alpha